MTTIHGIPLRDWPTVVRVPRIVAEAMWPPQHDRGLRRATIQRVLEQTHGDRDFSGSPLVQAAAARAADDDYTDWDAVASVWPDAGQAARAACRQAAEVLRAAQIDAEERQAYARWVLAVGVQIEQHWRASEDAAERVSKPERPSLDALAGALLGPGDSDESFVHRWLATPLNEGIGLAAMLAFFVAAEAYPAVGVAGVAVAVGLLAWRRWGWGRGREGVATLSPDVWSRGQLPSTSADLDEVLGRNWCHT